MKIKKLFIFTIFFVLINILCANEFKLSYFNDQNNSVNIQELKEKNFKSIALKQSLDISFHTVWYKLELKNDRNNNQEFIIHNNFAYLSKNVDIYELSNNKILNQESYNLLDENVGAKLVGRNIIYTTIINANSSKIIYIKNQGLTHQLIDLSIFDNQRDSNLSLSNQSFYPDLIIIILFTLGFYNLFLFFFTKRKEFIFYSFYIINCAFGLFYMYGSVFQNFHIYGENAYLFNYTAIGVSFFLALFIKYIFDIDKKNKKINLIINSSIILSLIHFAYALFVDFYFVITYLQFLFLYSFIVALYVGVQFYKQNHPLSKIFLTAYSIYTIGFTFTLLVFAGQIEFTSLNFHGSGIALVCEGFLFSYMLSYRLKLLEIENDKQKHSLMLKNKKEQLGEIIGNIAHQWRQPLNRINLNIAVIQEVIQDETIDKNIIDRKIQSIDKNIHYMSDTIEDFTDFYNPNKKQELFNLNDAVLKGLNLLDNRLMNIETNVSIEGNITLYGLSNEYLQVLLIILNNAIDNFKIKNIKEAKIDIYCQSDNGMVSLSICDNGGGITHENIEKIFDPYFTTKYKSEGTGMGLYLARMIIETSMHGKIDVNNYNKKTIFTIKIPNETKDS